MSIYTFPNKFIWGSATASYQVEGAIKEDGRKPSTWDAFCDIPGKIENGDTGEHACDHYHRYKEDVQLMKQIGLHAYRFSIAWPRIIPDGSGSVNQKGIDFYDRLIDELLKNDITPYITLFHWDLPQILEDTYGGWRSKEVSRLFANYASEVVKRFSDRVQHWMTINEIMCFTIFAHRDDIFAPGKLESNQVINQTVHNAMLGHGLAVEAIRHHAHKRPQIGIVENLVPTWPIYDTQEHIAAAKQAWTDMNQQRLFPLLTGKYDEKYLKDLGADAPEFTPEEMSIIGAPCDFIGYNYYFADAIRSCPDSEKGYEILPFPEKYAKSDMGWPITPKALYYSLKFTKEVFNNIPVYVTENGMAAHDSVTESGEVLDIDRKEYLRTHLEMTSQAIKDGCDVRGYFVWSLMDNFEWSFGYSKRFGITRVDYDTMKRTLKLSGDYFSRVVKENRVL